MIQYLKWDDNFAVGIALFDDQHKKIMEMLNQLLDVVKRGGMTEKCSIIIELMKYASLHFGAEEDAMRKYDYPYLKKHFDEHNAIKSRLSDLHRKCCVEGNTLHTMEILKFITHWFDDHLKSTDINYGSFLIQKGFK